MAARLFRGIDGGFVSADTPLHSAACEIGGSPLYCCLVGSQYCLMPCWLNRDELKNKNRSRYRNYSWPAPPVPGRRCCILQITRGAPGSRTADRSGFGTAGKCLVEIWDGSQLMSRDPGLQTTVQVVF